MSQCLNVSNVRSAAAAVDSLGSAVDGAPHALVKRSPLVHAKGKKKKKCPRGKVYNPKKRKCVKRKGKAGVGSRGHKK